jgi:hypothetical protein
MRGPPAHGIERLREADVPVLQDEFRSCPGILQVHEQVPGLLDDPGLGRVLRGAQDPDAPAAVLDHGKDVHLRAIEQVSGEEVQRQDPRACDRRNSAHPGPSRRGGGSIPVSLRICQTVDGATMMPSPASSPWIRRPRASGCSRRRVCPGGQALPESSLRYAIWPR